MNILVDKVRIKGFRGIEDFEFTLLKTTVLIGTNNAGKTSILTALRLAFGDYSRYVSEEDFYIDSSGNRANEIQIDTRIISIDDNGERLQDFSQEWQQELGDTIQSEPDLKQFVVLRTKVKPKLVMGGYEVSRFPLTAWEDTSNKDPKTKKSFSNISFMFIDAQRDIHKELKEKSSFVGKVLSKISYEESDTVEIETLVENVNNQTLDRSTILQTLKTRLTNLNQSFQDSGSVEVTPFPKKIRDLSKNFSIYFGEDSGNTFSMEYHGMGVRSWASLLTANALVDTIGTAYQEECEPFFSILAVEEPEAHLHPNAQKTLYRQLTNSAGQVIVSTHSPYLAAMANLKELRHLKINSSGVEMNLLSLNPVSEEGRRFKRAVVHSKGEILFAKAIVLCEGETEEQALPMLFASYFGCEAFELGICFVSVGGSGKQYLPFLNFSKDFDVPVFIFSDGESETIKSLGKVYNQVFKESKDSAKIDVRNNENITLLVGKNFEEYLVEESQSIIESVIEEAKGEDYIESWIEQNHNKLGSKVKTTDPPCETCNQPILKQQVQDYKSTEGYKKALVKILSKEKPQFAPLIASKLSEGGNGNFPQKLVEIFENIKKGVLKK